MCVLAIPCLRAQYTNKVVSDHVKVLVVVCWVSQFRPPWAVIVIDVKSFPIYYPGVIRDCCRNRMTSARFPMVKTLDEFNLAESTITRASHNYLIALGRAAVTDGYKVRYFTAIELVEQLYRAVADNTATSPSAHTTHSSKGDDSYPATATASPTGQEAPNPRTVIGHQPGQPVATSRDNKLTIDTNIRWTFQWNPQETHMYVLYGDSRKPALHVGEATLWILHQTRGDSIFTVVR